MHQAQGSAGLHRDHYNSKRCWPGPVDQGKAREYVLQQQQLMFMDT